MTYQFDDNRTVLLGIIKPFLKKHNIADSTFGLALNGDSAFVYGIQKRKREPRAETCRKVIKFVNELRALDDEAEIKPTVLKKAAERRKQKDCVRTASQSAQ